MARGKRSTKIAFYREPSVPMVALVLKVMRRHGWPRLLDAKLSGTLKAHVIYEVGGSLHSSFKDSLILYRRVVTGLARDRGSPKPGRRLAQVLSNSHFLREMDVAETFGCSKIYDLLTAADSRWSQQVIRSFETHFASNRFHPEAIVFRMHWPRIVETAEEAATKSNKSVRLSEVFSRWTTEEGWKWGIRNGDYDALKSQCLVEDREVDSAFTSLGFSSYVDYLDHGKFPSERVWEAHGSILEAIVTHLEGIFLKP